jgi:ribosomal protein L7/L12
MRKCHDCGQMNPPGLPRCERCGGPLSQADELAGEDLDDRVRSLMSRGQKVEAIRAYLEATGVGLKEAKDAVEALERGEALRPAVGPDFEAEVLGLLGRGEKIGAIKLYHKRTGLGWKESLEAVEALARKLGT